MELFYKISEYDNYINVKQILKEYFNISDRLLLKLKNKQCIFLNNDRTYVNHIVQPNDVISFKLDYEEDNSNIVPTKMNLDILYEDDSYLVINKPCGIAVHPSMLHYSNSLSNGVRYYFDKIGLKKKIRPVNRLDFDTSGIVIFAKNEYIQECLVKQMKNDNFIKQYIAICEGNIGEIGFSNIINAPIARKESSIIERCVDSTGDIAITHFTVLDNFNNNTCKVLCTLKTGRTHQIRVHMSYIGHPIVGDTLYGSASELINRQALHSYKVCFIHPIYKKQVEYIAQIPQDINNIIKK